MKPGEGNRWDQGYDVAAHFLDYCDGLLSGFVAGMNKKMRVVVALSILLSCWGKKFDQLSGVTIRANMEIRLLSL